ncbi:hypothetical protein PMI12_05283, partial [Variovorax sp. CF313]
GQIIVAVVAIVVTYFTAGALSGPMSAAFGATGGAVTTAGTVAAGAIGGAVGSIASQAVGIAIGAQDGFSWKGVALGAIGGAVSAGLGGTNVLPDTGNAFINGAMRGALGSTITQGVAVATGLQDKFSWKSVAASAVSAGVSQGLNSAMQYDPKAQFDFGKSFVSGFGGALVGTVVRGGKISGAQIAADAFGNIIGDALAKANNVPGVVGAEEKAHILKYFTDGATTSYSPSADLRLGAPYVPDFSRANALQQSSLGFQDAGSMTLEQAAELNAAMGRIPGGEQFEGVEIAGPGERGYIRKIGASSALKNLTDDLYRNLDDIKSILTPTSGFNNVEIGTKLDQLNAIRLRLRESSNQIGEVLDRGPTAWEDFGKLGVLSALLDPISVQRIGVATQLAGGVGRATGLSIAVNLSGIEILNDAQIGTMVADSSIRASAPAVYLNTLLDGRSHVDTTVLHVAGMDDTQFAQLRSYVGQVVDSGGLTSYRQNEAMAGLWSGLQGSPAAASRLGEGLSVMSSIAALGLKNLARGLTSAGGAAGLADSLFAKSFVGKVLNFAGPMYIVPPGPSLNSGASVASRVSSLPDHPNHVNGLPYGYKEKPFERFIQRFDEEFKAAGFNDVDAFMQGSTASGYKYNNGRPLKLDGRRIGPDDYDIAIVSPELMKKAESLGLEVMGGPLKSAAINSLGLADAQRALTAASKGGLPVEFKVYPSIEAVYGYGKTIPFSNWKK